MEYYTRIAYLTLISYACGLIILDWPLVSLIFFLLLIVLVYYTAKRKLDIFYQNAVTISQIIITMHIFGLIHIYTYHSIAQYMNLSVQLNEGLTGLPLLQIYLSFQCVYYYFEFQLNNNFHHAQLSWYCNMFIYVSILNISFKTLCSCQCILFNLAFINKICFWICIQNQSLSYLSCFSYDDFWRRFKNYSLFYCQEYRKHPEHQLITHGVYSFFRHPSYTGFFYYSVASQLFVGNFISAVGFVFVLIKFFKQRIQDQQYMLALFFQKYLYYKSHTYILIPFLKVPTSQQILKQIMKNSNKK